MSGWLDLEAHIHGLRSMTMIVCDMLDENIMDQITVEGERHTVSFTKPQLDLLCFAWNDLAERATKLEEAFDAAVEERKAAS